MPLSGELEVVNPAKIVSPNAVNDAVASAVVKVSGTVESANLADGAVTSEKLAANAVGTDKIADGAVSAAKLAAGLMGAKLSGVSMASSTGAQALTTAWAGVSGLVATVATAAGERVILLANVFVSGRAVGLRLVRNGSALASPSGFLGYRTPVMSASGMSSVSGFTASTVPLMFLDAPPAGTHSYAVQATVKNGNGYVNRSVDDGSDTDVSYLRGVSVMMWAKIGPEV